MSSSSPDKLPAPIDIFVEWLSRHDRGDRPEFEKLQAAHPAQAAELARVRDDWHRALAALARGPGTGGSASDSLSERLAERFGQDVDPRVELHSSDEREESFSAQVIQRLSERSTAFGRYQLQGEIARGGMGAIVRVWDEDLHRHLAMKVILGQSEAISSGLTPPVETSKVARFLEEAQVTGQLDHPGIVPVHELGLDPQGRVYFTMKLVRGRSLKFIFDLVAEGREGWTQTRALGVLLKVCEAMAYAHHKGVIHRDLKPGNIMVGKFGEVHVMDWGLARILDKADRKDIRIREESPDETAPLRSVREAHRGETPESQLYTMDGDVVGTPAYMPPEQAAGKTGDIGPHSDVYAVGAMLYHLIAGHVPYVPPGARLSSYAIWALVQRGPPTSLAELAPETPAELVAICDKAMARDWKLRYRDMSELASDLSAYLEHRVVGAYRTGAWAEAKKWLERNRPLAASLAAAIAILVAGVIATSIFAVVARRESRRADQKTVEAQGNATAAERNAALAGQNEQRAVAQERIATQKADDVLSLSAIQELKDLIERAELMWPALPEMSKAYEDWLADASVLIDGRAADPARGIERHPSLRDHESTLEEIRKRAKPLTPEEIEADRRASPRFAAWETARSEQAGAAPDTRVAELESDVGARRTFEFADPHDRWWHAQLSQLVADLKAFSDEKTGLFSAGTSPQHGWGVLKRRAEAQSIGEQSVSGTDARARWAEAIASIARHEKYAGLRLPPQIGLLPIGEDADSHLWEFAHLQSGEPAQRGADGKLVVHESTGLVFVLIPSGKFWMGAQKTDPSGRNYDPQASDDESPVHEVELSAYFLSKFEMTQGQWMRAMSNNPSGYGARFNLNGHQHDLRHPAENVSWNACMNVLFHLGLSLPSEAQWENGCRAGTSTPAWAGADRESLRGKVNIADQAFTRIGGLKLLADEWPDLDDGWAVHAPAGTFAANAFGLHEVLGNVLEWCFDGFDSGAYRKLGDKDPVAPWRGASRHPIRGGSFDNAVSNSRSALRDNMIPEYQNYNLGLRPVRGVTP